MILQSLTEERIPTGIRYEDKRLGMRREVLHSLDLHVRCARRECEAKNKKRRRNLHEGNLYPSAHKTRPQMALCCGSHKSQKVRNHCTLNGDRPPKSSRIIRYGYGHLCRFFEFCLFVQTIAATAVSRPNPPDIARPWPAASRPEDHSANRRLKRRRGRRVRMTPTTSGAPLHGSFQRGVAGE